PTPRITAAVTSVTPGRSGRLRVWYRSSSSAFRRWARSSSCPKAEHATDCRHVDPAWRELGRTGHQLRAVLGERRKGRIVPVRRPGPPRAGTYHAARTYRGRLARLSQRRIAWTTVWLPGARALRPGAGSPVQ